MYRIALLVLTLAALASASTPTKFIGLYKNNLAGYKFDSLRSVYLSNAEFVPKTFLPVTPISDSGAVSAYDSFTGTYVYADRDGTPTVIYFVDTINNSTRNVTLNIGEAITLWSLNAQNGVLYVMAAPSLTVTSKYRFISIDILSLQVTTSFVYNFPANYEVQHIYRAFGVKVIGNNDSTILTRLYKNLPHGYHEVRFVTINVQTRKVTNQKMTNCRNLFDNKETFSYEISDNINKLAYDDSDGSIWQYTELYVEKLDISKKQVTCTSYSPANPELSLSASYGDAEMFDVKNKMYYFLGYFQSSAARYKLYSYSLKSKKVTRVSRKEFPNLEHIYLIGASAPCYKCTSVGKCNTKTNKCECQKGFTGNHCERTSI